MIPYWRKKEYTDDGCSTYECLSCYDQWEARTSPGSHYKQEDGTYQIETYWRYCPSCGIKWEGEHIWDVEATYEKKRRNYEARGGSPIEIHFRVEYQYSWTPEMVDGNWSKWEWLQDHEFYGDEEFEKFRKRNQPPKYNKTHTWYLNSVKFAKLVIERANIKPPTCDFYNHTEAFKVRVVRQEWKGCHMQDSKVLWESDEVTIKHKLEWADRM